MKQTTDRPSDLLPHKPTENVIADKKSIKGGIFAKNMSIRQPFIAWSYNNAQTTQLDSNKWKFKSKDPKDSDMVLGYKAGYFKYVPFVIMS